MTFYEFIVPVIALAIAGVGIAVLRREALKLDHPRSHHPAE